MFGIGGFELFIILIFGFLIFGPEKLPEVARTVGKGIARFREAQADMNETLGNEKIFDPDNPDEPFKDPIEALDKLAARQEEKRKAKESADSSASSTSSATSGQGKASGVSSQTSSSAAQSEDASGSDEARQESFTERKARYERERAARKAAEAAKASKPAEPAQAAEPTEPAQPAQPASEAPASSANVPATDVVADASIPDATSGGEA